MAARNVLPWIHPVHVNRVPHPCERFPFAEVLVEILVLRFEEMLKQQADQCELRPRGRAQQYKQRRHGHQEQHGELGQYCC